jgi:hypothetical protein
MRQLHLRPALLHHLMLVFAVAFTAHAARPPQGVGLSITPLSAHFFTRLADVIQFMSQLDCKMDGGDPSSLPHRTHYLPPPHSNAPPLTPPGIACDVTDRSSMLSNFLGDDFLSSSLDVNSLTQEQLMQPISFDGMCYGVATTTMDIM